MVKHLIQTGERKTTIHMQTRPGPSFITALQAMECADCAMAYDTASADPCGSLSQLDIQRLHLSRLIAA